MLGVGKEVPVPAGPAAFIPSQIMVNISRTLANISRKNIVDVLSSTSIATDK